MESSKKRTHKANTLSMGSDPRNNEQFNYYQDYRDPIHVGNENIICIEMINNNKLYIEFGEDSTVDDIIKKVITHREFQKLYPNKDWLLNSEENSFLFDLQLLLFRNIKSEKESKVDLDIKLNELKENGLIKSSRHPFFRFLDNRNNGVISISIKTVKQIMKEYESTRYLNLNKFYSESLPRINTFHVCRYDGEISEIFEENNQRLNSLNKLKIDNLISEKADNSNWFTHDDESMNFLMKMEMTNFEVDNENILFTKENILFFQDKLEDIPVSPKEFRKFFITILISQLFETKFEVNLYTKAIDILNKVNDKLLRINNNHLVFQPNLKALKARSTNDYILDLNLEIGYFNYVINCLKTSVIPEFIIIDHPDPERNLIEKFESNSFSHLHLSGQNVNNLTSEKLKGMFDDFKTQKSVGRKDSKPNFSKIKKFLEIGQFVPGQQLKNDTLNLSDSINPNRDRIYPYFKKRTIRSKIFEKSPIHLLNESLDNIVMKKLNALLTSLLEDEEIKKRESEANSRNAFSMNYSNITKKNKALSNNRLSNLKLDSVTKKDFKSARNIQNIFDRSNSRENHLFSFLNSDINIENLQRKFVINFMGIEFKKNLQESLDMVNFKNLIEIKCILVCGIEKLSRKRKIIINFKNHISNLSINKKIYFDILYANLPMITSVLFKIKHISVHKKDASKNSKKTISWVNFRLFDHLKRLKTGIHKVYLFESSFSDFSYFNWSQNYSNLSNKVYFELESFLKPVIGKTESRKKTDFHMETFKLELQDQMKITEILERSPFESLSSYDRRTIWNNRYALTQIESAIPLVFQCMDIKTKGFSEELDKIVNLCHPLPMIKAMQLLTGQFLHDEIRNYAVKSLECLTSYEIQDYMIQLIQSLKYEMNHDSALARYLLKIAIKYPLTIGHNFFWNLKSEIYNPDYQQRFGLYLEVFLNKIGVLRTVFESEIWLISQFLDICDLPHEKTVSKIEIMERFQTGLKFISKNMEKYNSLSLPIDFKIQVKNIIIHKCRIMKSKKKPIRFVFKNLDEFGEDIVVMFKKGDDLRQDILTLQLFKSMQNLWFDEGLKLKMSLYKVISTGYFQGMCQFVTNSDTLATIHKKSGGATTPLFSNKSLSKWLEKFSTVPKQDYLENFLSSCASYCVATFVLGIGDRHNDNIMIKKNGEIFHIDFGHFLGHFKYKYGIKRERAPFVFTSEFLNVLGGANNTNYNLFKETCYKAYQILRKNSEMLITLLQMMICTGIPELNSKSIRTLESSLALNLDSQKAKEFLFSNLEKSLNAFSTKINFAIHIMANK